MAEAIKDLYPLQDFIKDIHRAFGFELPEEKGDTMKRYERMTKEEIIEAFQHVSANADCSQCMIKDRCGSEKTCPEELANYLNEEFEMVPRYSLIKSDEDLDAMTEKFNTICTPHKSCDGCVYRSRTSYAYIRKDACFANWLKVKVEKP